MRALTANVVLVGGRHDPAMVGLEFLKDNAVVPPGFVRDPQAPNEVSAVGTRLFFKDSWRLVVGPDRLHVFKDAVVSDGDLRTLAGIVTAYMAAQPAMVHSALGTNFHAFLPQRPAARWISDHFLPRDEVFADAVCPSLTMRFAAAGAPLTVTFRERPGRASGELEMVECDANMHRNLGSVDQAAVVAAALDHIVSDANYVDALLGAILAVECA